MRRKECACGCGASLADLRADATVASDACRARIRRRQSAARADKGLTRRLSRDGRGTKVYLTPEDLVGILGALTHARGAGVDKLRRAYKRLDERRVT